MMNKCLMKIQELRAICTELAELKKQLRTAKIKYRIEFLTLKYSDEYQKFKTIKEKEERAELQMLPKKEAIAELESKIDSLRYERDVIEDELDIITILYGEKDD